MNFRRIKQIIHYGWLHAGEISKEEFSGKKKVSLFLDIIKCYRKYMMWSNQYKKVRMYSLSEEEREAKGRKILEQNKAREEWTADFFRTRKFLAKWSDFKIEASPKKRDQRNKAYQQ